MPVPEDFTTYYARHSDVLSSAQTLQQRAQELNAAQVAYDQANQQFLAFREAAEQEAVVLGGFPIK